MLCRYMCCLRLEQQENLEIYPFGTGERVLRATKLSFVDSVWEILGAFLQRIPLIHLQRPRQHDTEYSSMRSVVLDDSARFLEVMRGECITRFTAVPSVLEVLLLQTIESALRTALVGLRYVLSSGETLSLRVVQNLTNIFPDVTILNLYGSTELSGDVTCMELKAPLTSVQITEWQHHGVPIGHLSDLGVVSDDTSLILLADEHEKKPELQLSSDMQTIIWPRSTTSTEKSSRGLLYVSGSLLALGYVGCNQQEVFATSEQLLSRHGGIQHGMQRRQWFCTGDMCSVIQGHLYYCGRNDNVVKIRGQRVSVEAVERAVTAALGELSPGTGFEDYQQVITFTTTKEVAKYNVL
ncbi:hypothetical protein PHPALM_31507 [Phytophthora palmivora]|uniref:AMP-dependent synthetase/ligase domain-containing protein n=1 Tax=Phytophthora palmivora TaxID=4796 RepID=A0A2P4X2E9_9STRA|nr:hypothetical protein PHPALM_31507 [Phytophthora palmivora]